MKDYQFFLKAKLNLWKKNISNPKDLKTFENIELSIHKILKNYQLQNKLKRYARGISCVFDNHPDLITDYFIEINSKPKAYWLGWLFAEAWISKYGESTNGKKPLYRFGVACLSKDAILIKKFAKEINFDVNRIKTRNYDTATLGKRQLLVMRFSNFDFCEFLRWHGFIIGETKSNNIKPPKLKNREFYLAFLLGYFDGDGKQGTTKISSGSRIFLNQIKEYFKIRNKVLFQKTEFYDSLKNRIVRGSTYTLSLGPDLFNDMLANYQNSLTRKRIPKYNLRQRIEKANQARLLKNKEK
ncbi:MAG: hypothetical protein ACFFDH_10035 [Promethearchaeota archaeon]